MVWWSLGIFVFLCVLAFVIIFIFLNFVFRDPLETLWRDKYNRLLKEFEAYKEEVTKQNISPSEEELKKQHSYFTNYELVVDETKEEGESNELL